LLLCLVSLSTVFAEDTQINEDDETHQSTKTTYSSSEAITQRMTEIKTYLPNGKYWNAGKTESQLISAAQSSSWSQSAFGVTTTGCKHSSATACSCHGYKCTSNHYAGGIQCYGFARFIGYLLWPEYGNPQNL
jgi:hypothetical protein